MNILSGSPRISVVMGAFNAASTVARSLGSILTQEGVDLEVIVVNDGSTDGTAAMLDDFARRDARVRVIHQENHGLTRALIRGCAEARGEFIARQDADDISLPGRLAAQLKRACAPDRPVLVAVGCGCCTAEGELLYETTPPADPAEARRVILEEGRAICCHGALFFRRDAFLAVGGYRETFYYAQDIDLNLRLAAQGSAAGLLMRAYDHVFSPTTISGSQHGKQQRFLALARACQHARDGGQSEEPWQAQARELTRACRSAAHSRKNPSDGYYFMASCLRDSMPGRARRYYRLAWRHRPFSLRCIFRVVQSFLVRPPTWEGSPP